MAEEPLPPVPSRNIIPAGREIELFNDEYFSQLRKDADISDDFINEGWSYDQLVKGGGKGGTLMVFLWGKYIVKEMSDGDHKTMLEITQEYVQHLHNGKSLLCTVFLHYRDIQSGRKFFAMRNEVGDPPFEALYDLKGCADDKTIEKNGKHVKDVHKRIWNVSMWCGKCRWTEDRRRYYKGKQDAARLTMSMSPEQRDDLVNKLAYDMDWLASHRLMDYSLLVAYKTEDPATTTFLRVPGENGEPLILCLSIIDFLQKWTCGKRVARALKVFECSKATVPPCMYARRFQRHFEACLVGNAIERAEIEVGKPASDSDVAAKPTTVAPAAGADEAAVAPAADSAEKDATSGKCEASV
jgi:hypothetical protein